MKLKIEVPEFEKDVELDVPGVGLVKNGSTIELDKEQMEAYEQRVGRKPNEKLADPEAPVRRRRKRTKKAETPVTPPVEETTTSETAEEGGK